jgi:hypothetical protein
MTNTPWLLAKEVEADGRSTKFLYNADLSINDVEYLDT